MHRHGYIGRKMRLPDLKKRPAVVIVAFGTSSRARPPLAIFRKQLTARFPDHEIYWAYSSEIIRVKAGLPSLQETLARVEAAGFRRAVVQPLHIFPGTEYQQVAETCEYFPGLRVFLGETLLHRWEFIRETLEVVSRDFLKEDEGLNLLALHGTSLAADPVNVVYLGLERLVPDLYPNVLVAAVEGIPDSQALMARLKQQAVFTNYSRVKIIPMMYLAGLHAEQDLMGTDASWRTHLEEMGFSVECSQVQYEDRIYFKGLAYFPEIIEMLMTRLQRALYLADHF